MTAAEKWSRVNGRSVHTIGIIGREVEGGLMTCWVIERGAGRLSPGNTVCCEWYEAVHTKHLRATRDPRWKLSSRPSVLDNDTYQLRFDLGAAGLRSRKLEEQQARRLTSPLELWGFRSGQEEVLERLGEDLLLSTLGRWAISITWSSES